ncbi:MAG: nucleotidyltransferase domain-containing protein [Acidobacteriia bacterium]|nr:nucleotidyltransferase domain-containing protein [Terriglobia bacterium]
MTNPKLDEFVQRLKAAAGDNLKAVILYGSAVTGEFHVRHSDLNVLCVVDRADATQIEAMHEPVRWWAKQGHRPPLVFTLEELVRSADVFAMELLDMKSHHHVLFGADVLADISVPLHYHAIQVERELRTGWLRLRQAMLAAPRKPKLHLELMASSFSSFTTLFRHALIAMGETPAANKREAIARIAEFAGADPRGFQTVLDFREGKKESQEINVQKTLNEYFTFVEAVTDKFDRWLDTKG